MCVLHGMWCICMRTLCCTNVCFACVCAECMLSTQCVYCTQHVLHVHMFRVRICMEFFCVGVRVRVCIILCPCRCIVCLHVSLGLFPFVFCKCLASNMPATCACKRDRFSICARSPSNRFLCMCSVCALSFIFVVFAADAHCEFMLGV